MNIVGIHKVRILDFEPTVLAVGFYKTLSKLGLILGFRTSEVPET